MYLEQRRISPDNHGRVSRHLCSKTTVSEVDSQDLFYYVIKILRHKANEKKHSSEKKAIIIDFILTNYL